MNTERTTMRQALSLSFAVRSRCSALLSLDSYPLTGAAKQAHEWANQPGPVGGIST